MRTRYSWRSYATSLCTTSSQRAPASALNVCDGKGVFEGTAAVAIGFRGCAALKKERVGFHMDYEARRVDLSAGTRCDGGGAIDDNSADTAVRRRTSRAMGTFSQWRALPAASFPRNAIKSQPHRR